MHILAFILMFIFASLSAAGRGDYSGLAAIGRFVVYTTVVILLLWFWATRPILMGIIFFVIIGIAIASNNKDKRR